MSTPTLSPGISVTAPGYRIAMQANGYRSLKNRVAR